LLIRVASEWIKADCHIQANRNHLKGGHEWRAAVARSQPTVMALADNCGSVTE
jgi:hypothetical protein